MARSKSRFSLVIDIDNIEKEVRYFDTVINDLIEDCRDEGIDLNTNPFETASVTCFSKDGRKVEFIEFGR